MLKFRPYKKIDAQIIASWITSEWEFYEWSAGILGDYPLTPEMLNAYADSIEYDDTSFHMVATEGDRPMGDLAMRFPDEERREVRLGFVIVDPGRRRAGYGNRMLGLALKFAFDLLRAQRVTLKVFEENELAYRTYRSV